MSGGDDIEAIKQRKKARLMQQENTEQRDAPDEPIHVENDDHFNEIVGDHDIVVVDFYADWCGPCKMLEPTVEDLAADTEAAVAKVDIDAHQQLAGQYQVRSVPTVMIFAGGEVAEQVVGVRDGSHYRDLIERHASA